MESISRFFKEEYDYLYVKGRRDAALKRNKAFVINLLGKTNFSLEKVADIAGVDIEFVKEVKFELKNTEG